MAARLEVDEADTPINGNGRSGRDSLNDGNPRNEPACCRNDGCCAAGKPCGKYVNNPFSWMMLPSVLAWTGAFVITFIESSTGNRVLAIWQYMWFFGTLMVAYFCVYVLTLVLSGSCKTLNYPVQSTEHPSQAQYGPIRDFALTSLLCSVIVFAWVAAYSKSIDTPLYDALNSINSATAAALSTTLLGVNGAQYWQLNICVFTTIGALFVWRAAGVFVQSEIAPMRTKPASGGMK